MFEFILSSLAVWRITSLLVNESGLFHVFEKIRYALNPHTAVLTCFWCASLWISVPFAFLVADGLLEIILSIFALSTISIILETVIERLGE